MARVLCISSQVVWGPVGNTAAVPPLQGAGHEVLQLPTVLLSHHPGHGVPVVQKIAAENFAGMISAIEEKNALTDLSAVMTGYFADAAQVETVAALAARLRTQNSSLVILVDPVLGDHGALYVGEGIAGAIRDQLLPLATIATPNAFELSWLTGLPVSDEGSAAQAAASLAVSETIVTSIPLEAQHLGTLLLHDSARQLMASPRRNRVPHGTGDFLAGCYLAERLKHPPGQAFTLAMQRLEHAISLSAGPVLATA